MSVAREPLVVEVDLTPDDLRRFHWHALSSSVGIVLVGCLALCTLTGGVAAAASGRWGTLLGALLFAVIVGGLWWWNGNRAHAKLPRTKSVYRFTEDHLEVEAGASSAKLAWSDLQRWTEDRHAFYVFPQPNVAHLLPKRCAADPEAIRSRLAAIKPATRRGVGRVALAMVVLWAGLCVAFVVIYNAVAGAGR